MPQTIPQITQSHTLFLFMGARNIYKTRSSLAWSWEHDTRFHHYLFYRYVLWFYKPHEYYSYRVTGIINHSDWSYVRQLRYHKSDLHQSSANPHGNLGLASIFRWFPSLSQRVAPFGSPHLPSLLHQVKADGISTDSRSSWEPRPLLGDAWWTKILEINGLTNHLWINHIELSITIIIYIYNWMI